MIYLVLSSTAGINHVLCCDSRENIRRQTLFAGDELNAYCGGTTVDHLLLREVAFRGVNEKETHKSHWLVETLWAPQAARRGAGLFPGGLRLHGVAAD